jgi:hypothetical protein
MTLAAAFVAFAPHAGAQQRPAVPAPHDSVARAVIALVQSGDAYGFRVPVDHRESSSPRTSKPTTRLPSRLNFTIMSGRRTS